MSSVGSINGSGPSNKDSSFDATMGTTSSKSRAQTSLPIRRPSSSSLLRQYISSKEVKSGSATASPPVTRTLHTTGSEPSSPQMTGYDISISRSSSSASRKTVKSAKPGLLKLTKGESRLKIKPFVKSRVTFSDDTKSEYNKKHLTGYYRYINIDQATRPADLTLSSPELSETDLINAFASKNRKIVSRRASALASPTLESATIDDTTRPVLNQAFIHQIPSSSHQSAHRRTSYDQMNEVYSETSTVSSQSDFWLRHQSLPNIQEIVEESPHQSPTSTEGGADFSLFRIGSRKNRPPTATDAASGSKGGGGSCDFPKSSAKKVDENVTGSDSVFCGATVGRLLAAGEHQKVHLSRQSEIEEDICIDSETGPHSIASGSGQRPLTASERRDRFSKDSGDSGNSMTTGNGSHQSLSLSKCSLGRPGKGKRSVGKGNSVTSKQSSTDSESGSYATACSVFVPISEEDVKNLLRGNKLSMNSTDSSISSFSSAKDQQFIFDSGNNSAYLSSAQLMQSSSSSLPASGGEITDISTSGGGRDGASEMASNGGGNEGTILNPVLTVSQTSPPEQSGSSDNVPKIIVLPTSPRESQMDINKMSESDMPR